MSEYSSTAENSICSLNIYRQIAPNTNIVLIVVELYEVDVSTIILWTNQIRAHSNPDSLLRIDYARNFGADNLARIRLHRYARNEAQTTLNQKYLCITHSRSVPHKYPSSKPYITDCVEFEFINNLFSSDCGGANVEIGWLVKILYLLVAMLLAAWSV